MATKLIYLVIASTFFIALINPVNSMTQTKKLSTDTPEQLYKLLDNYRQQYNIITPLITSEKNKLYGMAQVKMNELISTFEKSEEYPHDGFDQSAQQFQVYSESVCKLTDCYDGNVYQAAFEEWIKDPKFQDSLISWHQYADANCQVLGNDWMCVLILAY